MKLSIRIKILISFVLLFIVSTLIQSYTYVATQNYFHSQLNNSLQTQTDKGSGEIESFLSNLYYTSSILGKNFQDNYNSTDAFGSSKISDITKNILSQQNGISQITYLSPDGHELYKFAINGETPQGQLTSENETLPFLSALAGKTSISNVYYLKGKSSPYIDIFSPIYGINYVALYLYNGHKKPGQISTAVIAIIKMQINLDSLNQTISNIKAGSSGFMYVVDNSGILIAHPDQSYVSHRPNLSSRKIVALTLANQTVPQNDSFYTNEKNIPVIAKAEEIQGVDWVAVTEEPLFEAYGFSNYINDIFYSAIAVSAILLIIIAFILSKNITEPIKKLKNATENIQKGQFQVSPIIESKDEVEILSRSFNSMVNELLHRESLLKNEKQETENEKARLLASINNLSLGFILTDNEDKVIDINQTLIQIIKSGDKTFGTSNELFSYLGDLPDVKDFYRKCKEEKKLQRIEEVKFRTSYLKILFSPVLINTNESIGTVTLVENITEAKLLARSKDEFFAVASHELRTPLTAIRGFTSLILDNFSEQLKSQPQMVNMITNIHESSIRLIKIVNNFLDASKLEQGKFVFNLQSFALSPIIESVVMELTPLAAEKNIYVNFDKKDESLPNAYAEPEKIKQVLLNLAGNSIKFTEKGGITIWVEHTNTHLKVLIKDTGLGVSEKYRQLLFQKFQQAGERILTRDAATGSGMGLYISKLMIEAMNGIVMIENTKLGEGSTFSFTIPIAK